jgi:hypothetical protein
VPSYVSGVTMELLPVQDGVNYERLCDLATDLTWALCESEVFELAAKLFFDVLADTCVARCHGHSYWKVMLVLHRSYASCSYELSRLLWQVHSRAEL